MNDAIKKPDTIEKISEEEMQKRLVEITKCINDPIYFCSNYYYIRSIDKGTIVIQLYKKQADLILAIINNRFTIALAARQSGKTTAYIAVALWVCFFMEGKEIVIIANKEKTAIGILKRIKSAYEWIPDDKAWIKPGVKKWSEKQVEFENGCSITAMASSSDAARSTSCYMLLMDEVAFIAPSICSSLFASVFPVLSRSETSKCVMVSTANGIGGLFYDIWQDATVGKNPVWKSILIDWWDVPGRDEKWKQEQIRGFGPGGDRKFEQEFGNRFLGSSPTLLDQDILRSMSDQIVEDMIKPTTWKVGSQKIGMYDITIYKEPIATHSYILGGDVSEGIGLDYSVAKVFDITNPLNIEEVATFSDNMISGSIFGYVLSKMARKYNDAYVACERNGVSATAIDALWRTFEYDNIVDIGSNKYAIGIFSNHATKLDACLFFRDTMKDPDFELTLHDGQTVLELQRFEKLKAKSTTTYEATTGHDDKVMSLIWAIYSTKTEYLERYYTVSSYKVNRFGAEVPARLVRDISGSSNSYFTSEEEFENQRKMEDQIADRKLKLLESKESGDVQPQEQEDNTPEYNFVVNDSNNADDDNW